MIKRILIILLSIISFNLYTMGLNQQLIAAIDANKIEEVRGLIEAGANVNFANFFGQTPLYYAISRFSRDHNYTAELLINKAIFALLISKGANVNAKSPNGLTPLHYVVVRSDKDLVELLIKSGANIAAKTNGNKTPLHFACSARNKDIIELLLESGVDKTVKDDRNNLATDMTNNTEIIEMLNNYMQLIKR